ncbi:MAG: V-type ATP synthase subunit I [Oscillospiraceae bacterium]|nr:V-type ATP synthase subunit I [Oscillospiraceae bacterium]MBO7728106.1 V-type ATP synthase subunit I [Oscillospiraceae bacterium]
MKRLTLAVIRSQKEALLKELIRHGCLEVAEIDGLVKDSEIASLVKSEDSDLMKYKQAYSSLQHGIDLLNRYVPKKSPLLSSQPEISSEEFLDETGMWGAVQFARQIEENDARIKRISAEESRQRSVIESLKPWADLTMPLNTDGTDYAAVLLGMIPARISLEEVAAAIEQVTDEAQLYSVSDDKSQHYVMLIALREKVSAVQEVLRDFGFTPATVTGMDGSARECIGKAEVALKELASEKQRLTKAIEAEDVRRDEMKLAADRMGARISMAEAEEKLFGTESVVLLEGWMPAEREEELSRVFEDYTCAYETRDPKEEEYPDVPVKLKNNRVTDGLNMVTNMYSLPAYGTVDPNPLMAPFFIVFFGLMFADIGYGILMIIAALFALAKIKPQEGSLSFCRLLLWGGIATTIAGFMTGSLFSDAPKQIYDVICASKGVEPTWQGLPRLFSPTEDSILVLVGSLILGWLHLNTGMVVSFVQKWKHGNKADAIWEEGSLWVLLVGAVIFALKKLNVLPWIPDAVAMAALIIGVVMLLFGAGRNAKGFGKVTAAFGCIYNTATGWFGDILSYSRIMALMLAGGVVGQVFNTVAIMPAKNGGINAVTVIAFVVIFLLGHAMNFGLNLLGCYVHDLRLQCLEFFGKFYQDGGKPFKPLKLSGKYVRAKN